MSIITFTNYHQYDEDRIAALWKIVRMARELNDVPELWKLTDPWLDAISDFLDLNPRTKIFSVTFLDTQIDTTSANPSLICENATYPISLIPKEGYIS